MKKLMVALSVLLCAAFAGDGNFYRLYVEGDSQLAGALALDYTVVSPNTGTTVNVNNQTFAIIIKNAATIATLGIVLPSFPLDGQRVEICPIPAVTALTVATKQTKTTIVGTAATSLTALTPIRYQYVKPENKWYRIK